MERLRPKQKKFCVPRIPLVSHFQYIFEPCTIKAAVSQEYSLRLGAQVADI